MERQRLLAGDERGGPENPKFPPFPRARWPPHSPGHHADKQAAPLPLLLAKTAEAMGGIFTVHLGLVYITSKF